MTRVLTTSQMRQAEEEFIQGHSEIETALMEKAGQQAAAKIIDWLERNPTLHNRPLYVLCGPGNNGGDGFVIARLLLAAGFEVSCWEYNSRKPRSHSSIRMREELQRIKPVESIFALPQSFDHEKAIIIDSLFGLGLKRPLAHDLCTILSVITEQTPVLAIDVLSGLNSDSGRFLSETDLSNFKATLTLTFQLSKWGHHLNDGPSRSGHIKVISIGLEDQIENLYQEDCLFPRLFKPTEIPLDSVLSKQFNKHKYNYGHLLVLSGGPGKVGAARLAALSALRVGTGLVTLGVPSTVFNQVANQIHALMAIEVNSSQDLREIISNSKINTLCLGMGLGIGHQTRELVCVALREFDNVVLDADALTSFADNPEELFNHSLKEGVATPHFGEFKRLFPILSHHMTSGDIEPTEAVIKASSISKMVIVLKGLETIIAAPTGQCRVCKGSEMNHVPWLATAGSGDVLAGMIAGLIARGLNSFVASVIGVHLHQLAAQYHGPGLISEDLPNLIPKILQQLEIR